MNLTKKWINATDGKRIYKIQYHLTHCDILQRMTQRIGIFGGTFDPPHLGHLILASEARTQLQLSRLLWVLTSIPPHKTNQPISQLDDRLAMLKLALIDEPGFELSSVDMDRPGPQYTLDTINLLAQIYPEAELIPLIGGDSLRDLPTWHNPVELAAVCQEIGVMRRLGDSIDLSSLEKEIPGISGKVRFVDAPLLEIASHEIRQRVREGLPFRYYLLPSVYRYIIEHKLYLG
jgi:nicotinate-nucleotide adenylyltransferase